MRTITCPICKRTKKTNKITQRFCSHSCWARSRKGKNSANWKGGRRINVSGYVLILKSEHPQADIHGYIFEHRFIMEQKLGRMLFGGEIVHHIDGNKQNNSPENLILTRHGLHEKEYHSTPRKKRVFCPCGNITIERHVCHSCYKREWRKKRRENGEIPS